MSNTQLLQVQVRTRQGLVFDGSLASVSSVNSMGPFDVLPQHANFISMISKKLTLRRSDGRTDEMEMEDGVMIVEENKVRVFLGIVKA
jgi:F0F1-type ATP synthase epsilon subunit